MYAESDSAIDNIGMAGDRIDMRMIEDAAGLSDNDFDSDPDYLTKKSLPEVKSEATPAPPVSAPALA